MAKADCDRLIKTFMQRNRRLPKDERPVKQATRLPTFPKKRKTTY